MGKPDKLRPDGSTDKNKSSVSKTFSGDQEHRHAGTNNNFVPPLAINETEETKKQPFTDKGTAYKEKP